MFPVKSDDLRHVGKRMRWKTAQLSRQVSGGICKLNKQKCESHFKVNLVAVPGFQSNHLILISSWSLASCHGNVDIHILFLRILRTILKVKFQGFNVFFQVQELIF